MINNTCLGICVYERARDRDSDYVNLIYVYDVQCTLHSVQCILHNVCSAHAMYVRVCVCVYLCACMCIFEYI